MGQELFSNKKNSLAIFFTSKINSVVLASFFSILCLTVILFSEGFMERNQPDSSGYINFSAVRTSFYPIFIKFNMFLFKSLDAVVVSQVALYLFSLFCLIYSIHERFCRKYFVTVLFGFGITLNIYLQAYHLVILTESLTFTLINIFIAVSLNRAKFSDKYLSAIIGVIAGALFALKPAMLSVVLCLPLILLYLVTGTWRQRIICIAISMVFSVSIVSLEKSVRHITHGENKSLASLTLRGKAAILTTYSGFEYPKLDGNKLAWLSAYEHEFAPFRNWAESQGNSILGRNMTANFEVLAQYSGKNFQTKYQLESLTDKQQIELGLSVIQTNFTIYVSHSFRHLVSLWSVHDLSFMLLVFDEKLPKFQSKFLNSAVPGEGKAEDYLNPQSKSIFSLLSLIVFPAFCILGLLSLIIFTIYAVKHLFLIVKAKRDLFSDNDKLLIVLSIVGWSNLIFVAFVNIATVRYLMPMYPLFLLINLVFAFESFSRICAISRKSGAFWFIRLT